MGSSLHPYPWQRCAGGLVEDHRKRGGSGTLLDNDDGEHDNNWLGYWPARLYDKDDPVDKEETRAMQPSSRGATIAATASAYSELDEGGGN